MYDDDFSDDEILPTRRGGVKPIVTPTELCYKTTKNRQPTKHVFIPRDRLLSFSSLAVKLVPIKLDIEIESLKLKDCFTWNLNGFLYNPFYIYYD